MVTPHKNSILSDTLDGFRLRYNSENFNDDDFEKNSVSNEMTTKYGGNSTFYLTGLTNVVSNKKAKEKMQQTHQTRIENHEIANARKNDFINYVLEDGIQYANIDSIEVELGEQCLKKHSQLDKLTKQKESQISELQILNSRIEQEIILIKQNQSKQIIENYNCQISKIKKDIAEAIYNFNSNQKILERSKQENNLTKQKLADTIKEVKIVKEQYKKFTILKRSTFAILNNEAKIFNELKEFDVISSINYLNNFQEKKERFNEIDFKLYLSRNLTIEGDKILSTIKIKSLNIQQELKKLSQLNAYRHKYNCNLQHQIIRDIVFTDRLSQNLNVSNVIDIIKCYHDVDQLIVRNRNIFKIENKVIGELTLELTRLEAEKVKQAEAFKIEMQKMDEKIQSEKEENDDYIIFNSQLEEQREKNKYMSNFVVKLENQISKLCLYLSEKLYKLGEVKKVINNNSNLILKQQLNNRALNRRSTTKSSIIYIPHQSSNINHINHGVTHNICKFPIK